MRAEIRAEFDRLLRFMTSKGARFGLALARYRFPEVGRALQVSAIEEARVGGLRVVLLDLSNAPKDVDIIEEIAALTEEGVAFVVGMESLLLRQEGGFELTPAIARLNLHRDLLPLRLRVRVVFWLSRAAASAFAELARDTYDVLRNIFEFDGSAGLSSGIEAIDAKGVTHLEQQLRLLQELHTRAQPSSILAADTATSLAKLEIALGRKEHGISWLERAERAYEDCGQHDLALEAREHRARILDRSAAETRPLVGLLEAMPSEENDELARRQLAALRALVKDRPDALVGLGGLLERHPAEIVREWWRTRGQSS